MIDKKITWALIFAIAIESAGIFVWAGGIAERLREAEAEAQAEEQAGLSSRLTRVEVKLELASAQLDRIEAKLDRAKL